MSVCVRQCWWLPASLVSRGGSRLQSRRRDHVLTGRCLSTVCCPQVCTCVSCLPELPCPNCAICLLYGVAQKLKSEDSVWHIVGPQRALVPFPLSPLFQPVETHWFPKKWELWQADNNFRPKSCILGSTGVFGGLWGQFTPILYGADRLEKVYVFGKVFALRIRESLLDSWCLPH